MDSEHIAGRAWLAGLPAELTAQRRVMAGLVDRHPADLPAAIAAHVARALSR
jgi:hypothetical protein